MPNSNPPNPSRQPSAAAAAALQIAEAAAASAAAATVSHEKLAVALGQQEERTKGMGEDLHDLSKRVGGMETEMRRGFSDIGNQFSTAVSSLREQFNQQASNFRDQMGTLSVESARLAAPKGIQWQMVAVFVTVIGFVALWASNFFGKDISSLSRENAQAGERLTVLSNRLHEESIKAAEASGAQKRDAYWLARDYERMQAEIERLRGAQNSSE